MEGTVLWEVEKDPYRRTVQMVVDGLTEGYYYEDRSDPGIFVVYVYHPDMETYVYVGSENFEDRAKRVLLSLVRGY